MASAEEVDLLGPFSALSYEIILHILGYVDGLDLIEWAVRALCARHRPQYTY